MRTINEVCEAYKAVFEGKKVLLNGHEITSDGVNWIVNNIPIDTIANKKKDLSLLLDISSNLLINNGISSLNKVFGTYTPSISFGTYTLPIISSIFFKT